MYAGFGHDQLCYFSETLEEGDISSKRCTSWAAPAQRGVVTMDASLSGWTLATQRYTKQLGPTVGGISAVGGTLHPETFQKGTLRETHSGKDGQYHSGIFIYLVVSTTRAAGGPNPISS